MLSIYLIAFLVSFNLVQANTISKTEEVLALNPNMRDKHNRIVMGQASADCDDAMASTFLLFLYTKQNYFCRPLLKLIGMDHR